MTFRKIALSLGFAALAVPALATDVTFNFSNYPPMNFERDGEVVGIGADQVGEIMTRAGMSYEMLPMKWSRAIALAENTPATCVVTAHTDERAKRFKWVEPLMSQKTVLVGLKDMPAPASLEDALKMRVGAWNADYSVDLLAKHGKTDIDLAPTMDQTLQKLQAGRIDLMPISEASIADLAAKGVEVAPKATLDTIVTGIACNLDTSEETMAAMQKALGQVIGDGTQATILARYQ